MKNILIIAAMVLFSCQAKKKTIEKNEPLRPKRNDSLVISRESNSAKIADTDSVSFLDSIARKDILSIRQIRSHTLIDSVYYSGALSNSSFSGDTVLSFYKNLVGALIEYNDNQSCIYKFLLIFNRENKNLSKMIVYSDCDQDESADYETLDYRLLNDSIFETIETYVPANSKKQKVTKYLWRISTKGEIDSLHSR